MLKPFKCALSFLKLLNVENTLEHVFFLCYRGSVSTIAIPVNDEGDTSLCTL